MYGDDDKFSIKDLVSFFKVEWTIVDENSKEVKKENLAHFEKYPNEPGHFVPECTYNKDTHATLKVEAVEQEKVEEDEAIVKNTMDMLVSQKKWVMEKSFCNSKSILR